MTSRQKRALRERASTSPPVELDRACVDSGVVMVAPAPPPAPAPAPAPPPAPPAADDLVFVQLGGPAREQDRPEAVAREFEPERRRPPRGILPLLWMAWALGGL